MTIAALALPALVFASNPCDSVPGGFSRPLEWHAGAEAFCGHVPSTNGYLGGGNPEGKTIDTSAGVEFRAGFSFADDTREGASYKGLYQGIGVGVNAFMPSNLLGNPVAAYVYQGMPLVKFGSGLSLGYEWQFGVAAGWRHHHDDMEVKAAVSTPVTALMGVGLKLQWEASDNVRLWAGAGARHYSNGNTSFPNSGVNTLIGSVGVSYVLSSPSYLHLSEPVCAFSEPYRGRWIWDVMVYGAQRKRVVENEYVQQVCPGRFAVAGLQVSALRQLNRYVAVGPSVDLQWDESAGLEPYWVDGTYGDDIRFVRPPFGKQIKAGVAAHAELTTPIFHINAGIGYDIINPQADKSFYQSLTLKTFVTEKVYINIGYRLGEFSTPQNLMLGLGFRL